MVVKIENNLEAKNSRVYASNPDDEIVISGISGKFPSAKNVAEFSDKLYNKVKMSVHI